MKPGTATLGITLAALVGAALGVGGYTFGYAEGWSYFSNDPQACINCHIMVPQYSSWVKSSHHAFAVCNDCHLPHAFVPKWVAKARNGFNHAWAFTFQNFHEPIRITPLNEEILQENCVECHGDFLHPLLFDAMADPETGTCMRCHADVGHGPRAGLGR